MKLIKEKIKEKFGNNSNFAEAIGVDYTNIYSKLRTIKNQINKVDAFLKPLDLKLIVSPKMSLNVTKEHGKWLVNGKDYKGMNNQERRFLNEYFMEFKIKPITNKN